MARAKQATGKREARGGMQIPPARSADVLLHARTELVVNQTAAPASPLEELASHKTSSNAVPHPSLVSLVRLLARQAAHADIAAQRSS